MFRTRSMIFAALFAIGGSGITQAQDSRSNTMVAAPPYYFAGGTYYPVSPRGSVFPYRYYATTPAKSPIRVQKQYDPTGRNSSLAKPWLMPLR